MTLKPGTIVSFESDPYEMALLVPSGTGRRFCGEIVSATPTEAFQPGAIPDCLCVVRGRTGRECTISFVQARTQIHETWKEAEARCKPARKSP